ncbi:MAG: hypothetical protein ACRCXM_07410 [Beijerinckiaceae bacterium]
MQNLASKHAALHSVRLTLADAGRVYALAWLARPSLTQARWRAVVRALTRGPLSRGLITIEDSRNQPRALYAYTTDLDLTQARLLRVTPYAISSFPGLDVHGALIHSLNALGQQCQCRRVVVDFSECANAGAVSRAVIAEAGFELCGESYAKLI